MHRLLLATAASAAIAHGTACAAESTAPMAAGNSAANAAKPNIVVILADDLGYGDVHCLNPQRGKIPTPHIDKLATQGMAFIDAHSSSSVCTPSRYSILTGRYNWRTRLQKDVFYGMSDPPLIARQRLTLAGLLKQNGYATACIGKWKLVLCPGSGGWGPPPKVAKGEKLPRVQLHDMSADEAEQTNVQAKYPEIVKRLTEQLQQLVADGRSTPGAKQKNDVPVDIFKKRK